MPPMIAGITLNREKMLSAASDPALMATDLAEALVNDGMPFRTAHHRVGALVKWCAENNTLMNNLSLEQMKITIPEAKENYLSLFTPGQSVAKRTLTGGTAPSEVCSQISFWQEKLAE